MGSIERKGATDAGKALLVFMAWHALVWDLAGLIKAPEGAAALVHKHLLMPARASPRSSRAPAPAAAAAAVDGGRSLHEAFAGSAGVGHDSGRANIPALRGLNSVQLQMLAQLACAMPPPGAPLPGALPGTQGSAPAVSSPLYAAESDDDRLE